MTKTPTPTKNLTWKMRLRRIGEIYLTLAAAAAMVLLSYAYIRAWPDGQLYIDMNRFGEYLPEAILVWATTAAALCFVPRDLKEEREEVDE